MTPRQDPEAGFYLGRGLAMLMLVPPSVRGVNRLTKARLAGGLGWVASLLHPANAVQRTKLAVAVAVAWAEGRISAPCGLNPWSRHDPRPDPEAGFTLIEALVALALGMAVVVVVLSTLHIASNGAARAVSTAAQAESFARAGAILAGDAQHALRMRDGSGAVLFDGQAQSLSFAYMARFVAGTPALLRYSLVSAQGDTDVMRAEAVLLAQGAAGPFAPAQPIWHTKGLWEFRYLDRAGIWQREWAEPDPPRAFGLVALTAPQTVELVAAFPDLIEVDCALGSNPDCHLPAEVFP